MIIDVHGHITSPPQLNAFRAALLEARQSAQLPRLEVTDEQVREAYQRPLPHFENLSHMEHLRRGEIDVQLVSPRPISMMHSEEPAIVMRWTETLNELIYRACAAYPDVFIGIGGMPQAVDSEPKDWIPELRRCVTELGFVGTILNPDPGEGRFPPKPGLGDRYWYPVYEALCELGVPAFLHSTNCLEPSRETYGNHFVIEETIGLISLIESDVLTDFPELKVIISHGGGAVPYQIGRYEAMNILDVFGPGRGDFREKIAKVWFDTCLYARPGLECLFQSVGTAHTCFGTEKPGTGSQINPRTGRQFDEIKPLIEEIEWLSEGQRKAIFEDNAIELFNLGTRLGR